MNKNSEEIKKMQQDSIKHVLDMQSRAKVPHTESFEKNQTSVIHNNKSFKGKNFNFNSNQSNKQHNNQNKLIEPCMQIEKPFGGFPNLIDLIFKDSEKTLILILIVVLMGEEENLMMLLVLMFVLI